MEHAAISAALHRTAIGTFATCQHLHRADTPFFRPLNGFTNHPFDMSRSSPCRRAAVQGTSTRLRCDGHPRRSQDLSSHTTLVQFDAMPRGRHEPQRDHRLLDPVTEEVAPGDSRPGAGCGRGTRSVAWEVPASVARAAEQIDPEH